MMIEEKVAELLVLWEEARSRGAPVEPRDLCRDCPELHEAVAARVKIILSMEMAMGVSPSLAPTITDESDGTVLLPEEPLPNLPGHQMLEVINEGGMGIVYKAVQTGLGRIVAVKMVSSGRSAPRAIARFQTEAEAVATLQHPGIVQIFEVGQTAGRPYFTMEHVSGGNLAQLVEMDRITPDYAVRLMIAIAQAVQMAHEHGIVHRDLKPSNILMTEQGQPKLADFGLARRVDQGQGHTRTGEVLGTPGYMAPEQAEGDKQLIGPLTDVYALGAIFYEMLTGHSPFYGTSALEYMRLVTSREPAHPRRIDSNIPRDLEAICMKCLERDPRDRYPSAQAMIEDLTRFRRNQPIQARRSGALRRAIKWCRRYPQLVLTIFVMFLLAVVILLPTLKQSWEAAALQKRARHLSPQVWEILHRNCYECHGEDPDIIAKNLDILNHRLLLASDRRLVVPNRPESSRLIQRIEDGSMPPEEDEDRLPRVSEKELQILKAWIRGGAPALPSASEMKGVAPVIPHSSSAAMARDLFLKRCYECHRYDVARGGIKILNHRLLLTRRKVVVPGNPEQSELYRLVTVAKGDLIMPPKPEKRLSAAEVDVIRQWILDGAPPFPRVD